MPTQKVLGKSAEHHLTVELVSPVQNHALGFFFVTSATTEAAYTCRGVVSTSWVVSLILLVFDSAIEYLLGVLLQCFAKSSFKVV